MGRNPRIEFARAVYHVMSRGNHQKAVFLDDQEKVSVWNGVKLRIVGREWLSLRDLPAFIGERSHILYLHGVHYGFSLFVAAGRFSTIPALQ